MHSRSNWIWGGRAVALFAMVGLVAYLVAVGLDKADEVAGVAGLLVAVAALLAPYLLPPGQGSPGDSSKSIKPRHVQSVVNSVVQGHLTQVQDDGNVPAAGQTAAVAPPDAPPPSGPALGGQYVGGTWVGGNLTQVDGVDGDVNLP
jgi:hypothetical protein